MTEEDKIKEKNKGGRPKIPLITEDLKDLEKKLPAKPLHFDTVLYWMDLGATEEEIAGAHYISVQTLQRRLKEHTGLGFGELKKKVCGGCKIGLRKNQYNLTEKNASMGIWLGKQWLGQRDDPKEDKEFNGNLSEMLDLFRKMKLNPNEKIEDKQGDKLSPPLESPKEYERNNEPEQQAD